MTRRPPKSPLFPSTTLFRSASGCALLRPRGSRRQPQEREREPEPVGAGQPRPQACQRCRQQVSPPHGVKRAHGQKQKQGFRIGHGVEHRIGVRGHQQDRKSTRLNSSHGYISYAVFCLKKKNKTTTDNRVKSTSS